MRHFANGRANPSFPLTTASSRLVDALVDSQFDVSQPVLTALLREALVAHKEIIRDAKLGASVGPHLDLLRSTVAQVGPAEAEPIVQAWARIGGMNGPTAIVTGFDEGAGVLCGMGNLWKEDLFTCWYNIYSNADVSSFDG
jgi:diadenosine tetraphosphate (Ap4A) HIT family hydrolase